ncbi:glycosyltransferase 87 family protein [Nakamurella sp.]|uniref:glycosyltransferase 87 family protein n=1 Tax=Nakamurella sp. TaxID=1869182 RepID=UPI003B3AC694
MTSMRVVRWWDSLPRATRVVVVVLPVLLAAFAAWAFNEVIGQDHHQFDLRLYYDAINFWTSGHDLYAYSQPDPVNIELGFTYPPVGALLMTPMALLPYPAVLVLSMVGIVAAGAAFVYLVLRERVRLPKPLMLAAVGVVTAFAFTLEPFRQTLSFGQINIYLVLLVAVDLLVLGRRGSRWTGVGIGLATAIKLTPGIFILYLLVVGRWRAALTAIGTVIAANLVSLVIAPAETWKYFTALMWETSRVGFLDTTMNQSINGLLARIDSPLAPARLPWLILAALVVVVGFWRARRAALAGDELAAMTLAGLVGVLVSPVSWVHHIIWIFPTMLIIAMQLRRAIGELAADTSGYRSSDGVLLRRIAQVVGYSMLMTTGLAVWCIPTASLMDVKDWEYERGGVVLAFAGSVQLLWLLIALAVLPLEKAAGAGPVARAPRSPGEPITGSTPVTAVDTGSVPAAARANRVVLPAPTSGAEPRS